jgi:predicted DNA-binding transcriptional regulator AlpA
VLKRVRVSSAQLYTLVSLGEFPKQIRICQKISVWLSPDLDQWIDRQVQSVLEIQGYAANTQSTTYAYQTSEKVIRLPF